ncbi:MAG TPA: hypothetical protein PKI81_09295 [bacterium]|nr:hypothetical protein [bacterium]
MRNLIGILVLSGMFSAAAQSNPVLLVSPERPAAGGSFRVLAAWEADPGKSQIVVTGPGGPLDVRTGREGGGPPWWRCAGFEAGAAGRYQVALKSGRTILASCEVEITPGPAPVRKPAAGVWENRRAWGRESELLYAAWIEALFAGAPEGSSWPSLHEVTRRAEENPLFNHLGLGEDDPGGKVSVIMEPDCADNPFYLRAYFSWKLGLPFGFHEAGRGTLKQPPHTGRWTTNTSHPGQPHPVRAFNAFLRTVMNTIHSGAARTRLADDTSDYYPLPLTRAALRPGAVFADPYGHTFTLVRWIPQSGRKSGLLLAVDAQPDGTVQIKRFWKGNFLFTTEGVIGEPGFKAFRPIRFESAKPRLLTNREIAAAPGYGALSLEQKGMSGELFYDTMERLINPEGLDPEAALLELIKALQEQLIVRVESVANGETWMQAHPGAVIPMPGSAAGVFLAGGLWEDYSTPNRDLRLLIAIDAVLDFPARIVRAPGNYKISRWKSPEKVRVELEEVTREKTGELTITYTRGDGTRQQLTLAEILRRAEALEMGYNPNDGVEIRWGAPAGSEEIKSCRRRAPAVQLEQMRRLRPWFQKRLHPPT